MTNIKDCIIDYKEGMQITEPCIIRGLPSDVYHSIMGLSTSGIKMLLDCPALYFDKYLSGTYIEEEKACYKIGKACHTLILEGAEVFYSTYWHNPYKNLTKEEIFRILWGKLLDSEKHLRFARLMDMQNEEKRLLKFCKNDLIDELLKFDRIKKNEIELDSNELNQVVSVSRAINDNKYAKNAFSQEGESELSLFWQDEETGIWLKCRPDFLPYDCLDVPDYKTCASSEPEKFSSDFIKLHYYVQAAQYRTGIYEVTKHLLGEPIEVNNFFFVAQEKKRPFITQVFLPEMNIVDYGVKAVRKALEIYQESQAKEIWRTYSDGIITISLEMKPEDLAGNFDETENVVYLPRWTDAQLAKY